MKRSPVEEILRGGVFLAGIMSALIAAPFLYGADNGEDEPNPTQKILYDVEGMRNRLDEEKIRQELKGMSGVISTQCDYLGSKCRVEIDPTRVKKEDVAVQMNRMGFQAFLRSEGPLH